MRQRLGLTLLLSGLVFGCGWFCRDAATSAADKASRAKKPVLQKFMQAKLDLSQRLMEGLVKEDFALLEKNSKELLALSVAEEWNVHDNPLYTQHSEEFRRAVKQVNKSARDKNLDGASLSFVQLTMTCIECHRFVRNQLMAGKTTPPR